MHVTHQKSGDCICSILSRFIVWLKKQGLGVVMATKALPPKYKFVSEPEDELICLICLEVAEEPWQHVDCGRLLCKKCLDKLGKDKPCPYCRKQQPQFFPDNRGE